MEIQNTYDAQHRHVRKTVHENGQLKSDTAFVYEGWNVIAELDLTPRLPLSESPHLSVTVRTFVWGLDLSNTPQGAGGVGGLLAVHSLSPISELPSPATVWPVYDGNGNITAWFNQDAKLALTREYDAFGNIISETTPDNGAMKAKFGGLQYAFSTKPQDAETGWLYYGFRYYAPELGRWPSRDPIGEGGGTNLLAFVRNDGVNMNDYLGMCGECSVHSFSIDFIGWQLRESVYLTLGLGHMVINLAVRFEAEVADKRDCIINSRFKEMLPATLLLPHGYLILPVVVIGGMEARGTTAALTTRQSCAQFGGQPAQAMRLQSFTINLESRTQERYEVGPEALHLFGGQPIQWAQDTFSSRHAFWTRPLAVKFKAWNGV